MNKSKRLYPVPIKRRVLEYSVVYSAGAAAYSAIELLWRGFTHWTMFFVGGACFLAIYIRECFSSGKGLWKRCLAGSLTITAIELVSGCIINLGLKWNVWDYSKIKPHFLGQVCLLYSLLWFFLCVPICSACKIFRRLFHG